MGNATTLINSIAENTTTSAISKIPIIGSGELTMRENLGRINGMRKNMHKVAKKGIETLISEESPDIFGKLEVKHRKAIGGKVGRAIRLPGTALEAVDIYFKGLNYSGEIEALATRKAIKEGFKGKDIAIRVNKILKDEVTEEMQDQAWEVARKNTFTNSLGGDWFTDIAKKVKEITEIMPPLKVFIPFVRVTANLTKYSAERSPFSLLFKETREALVEGGMARDKVLARMAMGTTVGWLTYEAALKGMITGGYSSDPRQRAIEEASGFQEYSIKFGDKYYSYSRIEPFATIMGVSSDLAKLFKYADDSELSDITALISGSIAKNLTNKTYTKGISDVVSAFNDPDNKLKKLVVNLSGSVIPSFIGQFAYSQDPYLRDARSMLEKIKSRVPGYSETVEARLDFWGNPRERELTSSDILNYLNPIYMKTDKKDKITEEMIRLQHFPGMPRRKIAGIELTSKQYTEYVKNSRQPAHKLLKAIVEDPYWDTLNRIQKQDMIDDTLRYFQKNAREALMMEPEILNQRILLMQQEVKQMGER
jgi:hypothetical protein